MKDNQKDLKVKDNRNGQNSPVRPTVQENPKKSGNSSKQSTMVEEDDEVLIGTQEERDEKGHQTGTKTPTAGQDRNDGNQNRSRNENANGNEDKNKTTNQGGNQTKKQGGTNGNGHKS